MKRVALYARYSSDLQSAKSCEDQLRLLREDAAARGWKVVREYRDEAISGASIFTRPGMLALLREAEAKAFDVAFSEALDRISRDDADAPMIRKRLAFHGVTLWTQSEGEVQVIHTALKGAMNAMMIEELGRKVKRGHRGVLAEGRATSPPPYGYDLVPGKRGVWTINEAEAAIVRRIFDAYAPPRGGAGVTSREIAKTLNREGVASPSGKGWQHNTIQGNGARGTKGILFNPIYVGVRIYNRTRQVKNPTTGLRAFVPRPESEWIRTEVPALRIVTDEQFARVAALGCRFSANPGRARRPKRLLSGLLTCGCCGGRMVVLADGYYGCSRRNSKGTCPNIQCVSAEKVLTRIMGGLQKELLSPAAVRNGAAAFQAEWNRLKRGSGAEVSMLEREIADAGRRIDRLVRAIEEGADTPETLSRVKELRTQRAAAEAQLATVAARRTVAMNPKAGNLYTEGMARLTSILTAGNRHLAEFEETIRNLVAEVVVQPDPTVRRAYTLSVRGDLAALFPVPASLTTGIATAACAARRTQ